MEHAATDVAGEVMEVGSGVKNFKPGNKVVAVLSARVSTQFSYLPMYSILLCVLHQFYKNSK